MKSSKSIAKVISVSLALLIAAPLSAAAQGNVTKSESVYVNTDSTGRAAEEIVSDWLHDGTAGETISDRAALTGIKNVRGDEQPQISGDNITWAFEGNDIFYQGTTTKSLPIRINVHYYIDGSEVSAKDLGGRSGKLEIKLSFTNLEKHTVTIGGESKTVYTPFLCAAAFDLPDEKYSNVTASGGSVVRDGKNQIVSFITMPGLSESFDMLGDYLTLPETLDVTADVKNLSLGPIMILATPNIPGIDSLKNTSTVSDLLSKLTQLSDAGLELRNAAGTLSSSEQSFADGLAQLYSGITAANTSLSQIAGGAQSLSDGAKSANSGAQSLSSGAQALSSGAKTASSGAADLSSGASQIDSGAASVVTSVGTLSSGAEQLSVNLADIVTANTQITGGLAQAQAGASQLATKNGNVTGGINQLIAADTQLINAYSSDATLVAVLTAQMSSLTQLAAGSDQITQGIGSLGTSLGTLQQGSASLGTGLGKYSAGQQLVTDGLSQLLTGVQKLKGYTSQLKSGAGSLASGTATLSAGINTLSSGAKTLASGTATLSSGASSLNAGINKFSSGSAALKAGAGVLLTGSGKLANGARQLSDGVSQFYSQGVSKLNGAARDKIDEALQVKDELIKLSDSYDTFTGTGDNIKSNVKFIIKTAEITVPDTSASTLQTVAQTTAKRNFFQRIADWFCHLFS
ncbi:MAG: hypothetical protein P4M02_06850 [Clostridia bacterium]|nr:hypothetical protein [Clostridia bacterium]